MLKMTNVVREIEKDAAVKAAKEAMRQVAQKMLRLHLPVEQIAEVTQLSLAEIDALRQQPPR
jgi:predicted transposase YdaD